MRFGVALPVACLLFAAACSPAPAPAPKPDLAAEEKAVRDADAVWLKAAATKDAAAEGAVLASDGVVYREHEAPMVGPAAFQEGTTKFLADNPKSSVTWSTDKLQIAESADLAVQTGEFHVMGLGPKGDGMDKGRFVTVWKKVNGNWKVAHDIGSTTMPEVEPAKKP